MSYSKTFKEYFTSLNITIPQVPNKYKIDELNNQLIPRELNTPDSFEKYVENELVFWNENFTGLKGQQPFSSFITNLDKAKKLFDSIKNEDNFETSNADAIRKCFLINGDALNIASDTILAQILLRYNDRSHTFFTGFFAGIEKRKFNQSIYNMNIDYLLGLFTAYEYVQTIRNIDKALPNAISEIEDMKTDFSNRYNVYLKQFDELFESKILDIKQYQNDMVEKGTERAGEGSLKHYL